MSRQGGDCRGSAANRRNRKVWLLSPLSGFGGDGHTVRCHMKLSPKCLVWVIFETLAVDRIIPGHRGGTYRRENIQPGCAPCQNTQGANVTNDILAKRARKAARKALA